MDNILETEHSWARRARLFAQMLIVSVALNIGLLATFAYFVVQERQEALPIELKPALRDEGVSGFSKEQILYAYSLLPYSELLIRLETVDLVEDGLARRDIALACLVAFHHFNLEKALGGVALPRRLIALSDTAGLESIDVPVYPGLRDEQFRAILLYAKTEKWPLTPQGLFYELQRVEEPNRELVEAFCLSEEFLAVKTLFSKSATHEELVQLLCEGTWQELEAFTAAQRQALDLSLDRRREFLVQYLMRGSKTAGNLLLNLDSEYAVKHLSDEQILALLATFSSDQQVWHPFALRLLSSPRSDRVWHEAASVLYRLVGEAPLEQYDHQQVLARFAPQLLPTVEEGLKEVAVDAKKRLHKVEIGDSLWKIARRYRVTVEELKQINGLESDRVRVGKQLEIPGGS